MLVQVTLALALALTCASTGYMKKQPFSYLYYCERSELPSLFNARAVYIYIYIYIIVRASFRKCTSFLNSEYNFQFYWRVINVRQYRVRRNPRAQRCSVF